MFAFLSYANYIVRWSDFFLSLWIFGQIANNTLEVCMVVVATASSNFKLKKIELSKLMQLVKLDPPTCIVEEIRS